MSATESDKTVNKTAADKDSGLAAKNPAKRRKTLLIMLFAFVLIGVIWFLLWTLVFSRRETTDNAYVNGNQVAISAQVPGTVVAILADDTQHVDAGQILVKLDNTDADVRLSQTRSALAQAVRQVRQQTDAATGSDATVAVNQVALKKAEADLKRHLPLIAQQAEACAWAEVNAARA
jgi:membrane fusion protein (multidrug efflux system)